MFVIAPILATHARLGTSGTLKFLNLSATVAESSFPCASSARRGRPATSARKTPCFFPTELVSYAARRSRGARYAKISTNAKNAAMVLPSAITGAPNRAIPLPLL